MAVAIQTTNDLNEISAFLKSHASTCTVTKSGRNSLKISRKRVFVLLTVKNGTIAIGGSFRLKHPANLSLFAIGIIIGIVGVAIAIPVLNALNRRHINSLKQEIIPLLQQCSK